MVKQVQSVDHFVKNFLRKFRGQTFKDQASVVGG